MIAGVCASSAVHLRASCWRCGLPRSISKIANMLRTIPCRGPMLAWEKNRQEEERREPEKGLSTGVEEAVGAALPAAAEEEEVEEAFAGTFSWY